MAFLMDNKISVFGRELLFKGAYHKVTNINGDKQSLIITLSVFENDSLENFIGSSFHSFVPSVEQGSQNFIKQAYEFVKTLPEYEDVIDVFEE